MSNDINTYYLQLDISLYRQYMIELGAFLSGNLLTSFYEIFGYDININNFNIVNFYRYHYSRRLALLDLDNILRLLIRTETTTSQENYQKLLIIYEYVYHAFFTNYIHTPENDFNKVLNIRPEIVESSKLSYTPILENLFQLARDSQGLADKFLKNYSNLYLFNSNNPNVLSREDIVVSLPKKNWLGCYVPLPPYATDEKVCDPLCVNQNSIKLYNNKGQLLECNGTLCIIDNVSVYDTEGKGVTISQICPSCIVNPDQCRCVVDITVPGVLDMLQTDNIGMSHPGTFNQFCPNATCIQFNPITQVADIVQCDQTLTTTTPNQKFFKNNYSKKKIIWLGIGILLLLIIILAARHIQKHNIAYVPLY